MIKPISQSFTTHPNYLGNKETFLSIAHQNSFPLKKKNFQGQHLGQIFFIGKKEGFKGGRSKLVPIAQRLENKMKQKKIK
jgi:hypothetical protein